MIVLTALAFLAFFMALPFLCALAFHCAALVVEGLPARIEVIRRALRQAIGRNFRAPKGQGLQASKSGLARALRFPSMGVPALAGALASYKASQVRCATIRALVAVDKWIDAPGPLTRFDDSVRAWFMNGGVRRTVTAVKVAISAEAIGLRSKVRASARTTRLAPIVDLRVDPVTGSATMYQGATVIGTVVPTAAGPLAIPAVGRPYLAQWAKAFMRPQRV